MKINSKKLKQYPSKCKKLIRQSRKYRSNILCVNDYNLNTKTSKKLTKHNHNGVQNNLRSNLFALSLNIYHNYFMPKYLVLIGLF